MLSKRPIKLCCRGFYADIKNKPGSHQLLIKSTKPVPRTHFAKVHGSCAYLLDMLLGADYTVSVDLGLGITFYYNFPL